MWLLLVLVLRCGASTVLYVEDLEAEEEPGVDALMRELLSEMFTTIVVTTPATMAIEDSYGCALIFISHSCESNAVRDFFGSVPVPVWTNEMSLFDDYFDDYCNTCGEVRTSATTKGVLPCTAPAPPASCGACGTEVSLWDAPVTVATFDHERHDLSNANVLATLSNSPIALYYERGDIIPSRGPAPAERGMWMIISFVGMTTCAVDLLKAQMTRLVTGTCTAEELASINIANSDGSHVSCPGPYDRGTRCVVTCEEGYVLAGGLVCNTDGWTTATCEECFEQTGCGESGTECQSDKTFACTTPLPGYYVDSGYVKSCKLGCKVCTATACNECWTDGVLTDAVINTVNLRAACNCAEGSYNTHLGTGHDELTCALCPEGCNKCIMHQPAIGGAYCMECAVGDVLADGTCGSCPVGSTSIDGVCRGSQEEYLGCYRYRGDSSDDWLYNQYYVQTSDKNRVSYCQQRCREYPFFVLDSGDYCTCVNTFRGGYGARDTDCSVTCTGASDEICGGWTSVSTYRTAPVLCPNACSGRGNCVASSGVSPRNTCTCPAGFTGDDCGQEFPECVDDLVITFADMSDFTITDSGGMTVEWQADSGRDGSGAVWFSSPSWTTTGEMRTAAFSITSSSVLEFYHYTDVENVDDGGCWDSLFIGVVDADDGSRTGTLDNNDLISGVNMNYTNIDSNSPGALALADFPSGPGNAFCGQPRLWLKQTFTLQRFAGWENAMITFAYFTDEGTGGNGIWIDDVAIRSCSGVPFTSIPTTTSGGTTSATSSSGTAGGSSTTSSTTSPTTSSSTTASPTTSSSTTEEAVDSALDAAGSQGAGGLSAPIFLGIGIGSTCCLFLVMFVAFFVVTRKKAASPPKYLDHDDDQTTVFKVGDNQMAVGARVQEMLKDSSTSKIGEGLSSKVYKCKLDGTWVALKVIKKGTNMEEFHSEVNILSRLMLESHPNVIELRFVSERPAAIAMELCIMTLDAAIETEICDVPGRPQTFAKQTAEGMAFLHRHEIVHLDLKGQNLLLADDFVIKVTDFGISSVASTVSSVSSIAGTPKYLAPERIVSKDMSVDLYQADVYSYAMVLFYLFTGKKAHANMTGDEVIARIQTDVGFRPIVPSTVPPEQADLIKLCWARNPDERPWFQTIVELPVLQNISSTHSSLRF